MDVMQVARARDVLKNYRFDFNNGVPISREDLSVAIERIPGRRFTVNGRTVVLGLSKDAVKPLGIQLEYFLNLEERCNYLQTVINKNEETISLFLVRFDRLKRTPFWKRLLFVFTGIKV